MDITPIPEDGIVGETRIKEAAAGDYRAIIELVRQALAALIFPNDPHNFVFVAAIFADRVVIEREGRLWSYAYRLTEQNQVELGPAQEVVLAYTPVAAMREANGVFIESRDSKGLRWKVRIIRAGRSANKRHYSDAVLREAAPLFEGTRVFVKSDDEHLRGQGKSFRNLIGRLTKPEFVAGRGRDKGELHAELDLLESAGDVTGKIREAWERGLAKDLFGFSIDALGSAVLREGVMHAKQISKVYSTDLIIDPAAGGEIIKLLEARDPEGDIDMKLHERMIEAIKKANDGKLPEGLKVEDEEALEAAYREAIAKNTIEPRAGTGTEAGNGGRSAGGGTAAGAPQAVTREELAEHTRMVEARSHLRAQLAESKLPDLAKARIRKQFESRERFTEADVDAALTEERDYLAKFAESGKVTGLGDTSIHPGEDRSEKVKQMFDDFFDRSKPARSFKECYVEMTGDTRVTGRLEHCDRRRLREALAIDMREAIDSTTFADVLGNSIHRALLADYRRQNRYDVWRRLATVIPAADFRTMERTRIGGYGDLPIVGEGAPYGALASPTDEKATFAVAKRGGTETVTIETIRNDDVGVIRRIPTSLSRAAQRTLSKFALEFLNANPLIFDGVALFAAGHNNIGTDPLDAAALAAARLSVLKQTELSSADRIGVPPVNLWVPFDLEETAFDLFRRQTNNDTDFVESLQMTVLPVWYWTDANNWYTTTDPDEVPVAEIAFLDGEEPELFVQDSPTVGSLFTHDKITWKIRHIYGGNIVEYRGTFGSIVP